MHQHSPRPPNWIGKGHLERVVGEKQKGSRSGRADKWEEMERKVREEEGRTEKSKRAVYTT